MRVLHFNQYGSRNRGGSEGYISDVVTALQDTGHLSHLVYFITTDAAELLPESTQIPVRAWPNSIERTTQIIEQVIAKFRPDVAYIHAVYNPALVAWIAKRLPTISYVHSPYPVCPGSAQYLRNSLKVCPHKAGAICLLNAQIEQCCWGRNPIKHLKLIRRTRAFVKAYQQVGTILVGSHFMKQLLQRSGISPKRIHVLHPVLIREPIPLLSFSKESRKILFAGRVVPEKGLRHLIKALPLIKADWRLIVAGTGEDLSACHVMAEQLGIVDKIHFAGCLDAQEMATNFQDCACVVVPSLWPEPFGRVGPEAFLHGRPVVAFATGGIPEWLEDGVSGFLVEAGDIVALGQKIEKLLLNTDLRLQIGQQARSKALSQWNAEVHIEELLRVMETEVQKDRMIL